MLYSIKGKVSAILKKTIIVDTTDFEYEIFVISPKDFCVGEQIYLFLHHVIKEDDEYLVGFKDLEEKKAYKLLLNVQGIGPKTALALLSSVNYQDLLVAISNNDYDFIATIPGISDKMASQILLDLREYIIRNNKENNVLYGEVKQVLRNFGYKVKEIEKVLPKIYIPNATRDQLIKEALRRINKNA